MALAGPARPCGARKSGRRDLPGAGRQSHRVPLGDTAMRLARFELRRFLRGRLTAAALVVLAVIPLLYGALYLAAFWDPYGNLDRIPVALVNEDRPATAPDGSTVDAGRDLTDALLDRHVFGWHETDDADARRGLAEGRYHLIFKI